MAGHTESPLTSYNWVTQLAQIIILDTRWFRSPFLRSSCRGEPGYERYEEYGATPCSAAAAAERDATNASNAAGAGADDSDPPESVDGALTILGEEQWAWLRRHSHIPRA